MALTAEQKTLRRTGLGASEIATLAGLSRWSSPAEIWASKVHGTQKDATLQMDLGSLLEEPLARLYAKRRSRYVLPVTTLKHPTKPLALATPDRAVFAAPPQIGEVLRRDQLAEAERLLQLKSTTWRMAHEWGAPGTDEVPEDYHAQVTWEMGVSGVDLADFGVLFDKDRLEFYTVPFSATLFEALYEIGDRFWTDYVLTGLMPPADASDRYGEMLSNVYPRETSGLYVPASAELEREVALWGLYKAAEKVLKAAIKRRRNAICAAIANATGLKSRFGQLTWKWTRGRKKVDWQAVASDAVLTASLLLQRLGPELPAAERAELESKLRGLIAAHTETKPGGRRLTVKWAPQHEPLLPPVLELPALEEGADENEAQADDEATQQP